MNCVRERRRRAIKFLYLKHDYLKFAGRFCIAPRKYKLHFGGCKNNWRITRIWSFVYPVLIILIIYESGELLFHLLVKNHVINRTFSVYLSTIVIMFFNNSRKDDFFTTFITIGTLQPESRVVYNLATFHYMESLRNTFTTLQGYSVRQ